MPEARAEKDDSHNKHGNQRQSGHRRRTGRARRAAEGRLEERASQKNGAPKVKESAKAPAPKLDGQSAHGETEGRGGSANEQESGGDRHDEACQGRDARRDHRRDGLAEHTVRGFVTIVGSKGGDKIESSKNAAGDRTYRIAK